MEYHENHVQKGLPVARKVDLFGRTENARKPASSFNLQSVISADL